ncbi:MAG: Ni/Fe-hydrogenase cytochrome b subunit [bacterium]
MTAQPHGLLIDTTQCVGCGSCVNACLEAHGATGDASEITGLSANARTALVQHEDVWRRQLCMHCVNPSCASVCPVEALRKTPEGPVVYDESRCLGCRYCMQACPFGVPTYQWLSAKPAVVKCDFCVDRQARGEPTACAAACPAGATTFGVREELIREAHERIDQSPDVYQPHVYGEHEIGGTSVLFLSAVPFEKLGFPMGLGDEPLPDRTRRALARIPGIVTVGGALLWGVWWITNRREEVALAEAERERERAAAPPPEPRRRGRFQLTFWRTFFVLLAIAGSVLVGMRYGAGLGSVTNLSDRVPWGLWVGFDVLCGVGLAAGGFTITAMVHLFHAKRFEPIVRPTVLTAFLGYLLVVAALLLDLGRPWNLWHPLVMWNPHSVMFEVSWCVMLYTTVLSLELSGMVFEKLGWKRAQRWQRSATVPLVVTGVLLSTLHQSSLGAVYLIVPGKLHPLWYSPNLPWIFYVSSICVGLAMVVVESRFSSRAFGRELEVELVSEIGRILVAVLAVYAALRFFDLTSRGVLVQAFTGSYEARMFWVEIALGLLIPSALLSTPAGRRSPRLLYAACLSVVLGFVANRLNVSITGFEGHEGHYIPAWSEILISVMLVGVGFAGFAAAARVLPVFGPIARGERAASAAAGAPPALPPAVGGMV